MRVNEYIETERKNIKKKMFSKQSFYELLTVYLNDPEFESHVMVKDGDKIKRVKDYPVKKFRKVLYNVLVDFGVAPEDAEAVKSTYKFKEKTVEGMYDFISDFIYQYLNTGRKLKLVEKEDMVANIVAVEKKAEKNKERKFQGKLVGKMNTNAHKILKAESKVPDWEKELVSLDGKVTKAIEKILE